MTDPRIRFRLYIDGKLDAEAWVDTTDDDHAAQNAAIQQDHQQRAHAAEAAGQVWCAEVYDPAAPTDRAYLRMGTDPNVMRNARPTTLPEFLSHPLIREFRSDAGGGRTDPGSI